MQPTSPYDRTGAPPPVCFDEAVDATGSVRPHWTAALGAFGAASPGTLLDWQRQAHRLLDAEGAGHLVHELGDERQGSGITAQSRPWRVDPVPLVIDHREFRDLGAAVVQRVRLLETAVADLYGERRLLRSGVVSARGLYSTASMRTLMSGHRPPRWLTHAAIDLARGVDGRWRVVQDAVDTATGAGYALLNRSVVARVMPEAMRASAVTPVAGFADELRRALSSLAPAASRNPRTVVLSGGPNHASYIEQSYLATQMGFHLADGADLVVRANRVWLRALDGIEPVDVVYRRLEDAGLDPLDPHTTGVAGVPGISWAHRSGGVMLANAFGSDVIEHLGVQAFGADAAQELLGERLLLEPWSERHGIATSPCWAGAGGAGIVPGHVVVRFHLAVGPEGPTLLEGGNGRVLAHGDHPADPTSRISKDVWVVGGAVTGRVVVRSPQGGQVDFGASITRRAADGLFWIGRAAERAEVAARAARVIGGQLHQDPGLVTVGRGAWGEGALGLLRSARSAPPSGVQTAAVQSADVSMFDRLESELGAARAAVAAQISLLVDEAMAVRPYLSTTTGRVLTGLSSLAADLRTTSAAVDDLDLVLVDLAALAGLSLESVVRGPAWRFLDLGRRLERSLAVLGSIEVVLAPSVDPLAFQPLAEMLLWTNESLVAYRRRYRSDIELRAVMDLLVHDDANPRSLAFQLDRMREHVASLEWEQGAALVERASLGTLTPVDGTSVDGTPVGGGIVGGRLLQVDALVIATRGALLDLGAAVAERWFSDPVNPMVLGGA